MANDLSVEQRILCSQLESYSPTIKTAYLGAIHALHAEDHDDRLVHFAHSLREVIDLLTRKNQTDKERGQRLPKDDRILQLASAIDPLGKQTYGFDSLYKRLVEKYYELSEVAHHKSELAQEDAELELRSVEGILSLLTKPQTEILITMDKIMSQEPSKEGALKLKEQLLRQSSHLYLLDRLACAWLPSLDSAGFFDKPRPMPSKGQEPGTFPFWMPSAYLAKCASSMPDLVTRIIRKCKFQKSDERNPAVYDDFLKCSLEVPVDSMEAIAQKTVDEKWHDFIGEYSIAEKYVSLAERLYLEGRYGTALKMLGHFLDPQKISSTRSDHEYVIGRMLAEKIPRLAEKNPSGIIKPLASFTEKMIRRNERFGHDSSCRLLTFTGNQEQDGHQRYGIEAVCLANLARCMVHLGNKDPEELKASMSILSEKLCIFRKMEIFLYGKFPDFFMDEIARTLVDFFDVREVRYEYDSLIKDTFGKIDGKTQEKILDLIRAGSPIHSDGLKVANQSPQQDEWTLEKLEPIHGYLGGDDRKWYEGLVRELGAPAQPEPLPHHRATSVEHTSDQEFFSGKTANEVFDIIKEYRPTLDMRTGEDKTIASFKDFVRNNPMECSKKSAEIRVLDPRIQWAFLSAIANSASAKKKIEWSSVIALIESYLISQPADSHPSVPDPTLTLSWIIKDGLENQIDFGLKDRVWVLILRLIGLSNRTDVPEVGYPDNNFDSLTVSINDVGGLSFHMLFMYAEWCNRHEKSKDAFEKAKKVLEDYVYKGPNIHTISRHAAVGSHVPAMFYFDPWWTSEILCKMFSSKNNIIAFWDSYVSYNDVQESVLLQLHKLYDKFLNGSIVKKMHDREFYRSTIEHVMLGYLYDMQHFEKIFNRFVSDGDPQSISYCGIFMTRVLSENPDVLQFKDKITRLWKDQRFVDHADLGMWFAKQPFDRRENIQLFLDYVRHRNGKFMPWIFPLEELDEYADDFPRDVAECIWIFADRLDSNYVPKTLRHVLRRLLEKKMPEVANKCKQIIEILVRSGHNDYKDLL